MKTVEASDLISVFQKMYSEHWTYTMGAAEEGNVDCSGAFVYAFHKLGGGNIPHGSNSIYRNWIGWVVNTPIPGYAAFKIRQDGNEPSKFKSDGIGNVYHIGLVDSDGQHILNAKGSKWGFCRDKTDGWTCYAPVKYVNYGEQKEMTELYQAKVATESGSLTLRSGASKTAGKITAIPRGETVTVLDEEDNGYVAVKYGTLSGYVAKQFLTPLTSLTPDTQSQTSSEDDGTTTFINSEGVAITLVGNWRIAED